MIQAHGERFAKVEWFKVDEQTLADLRPGASFNARESFKAFGERQFGSSFAGVACCSELPGSFPPLWEAALELREQTVTREISELRQY
jgi:hypothetical protein